MCLFIHSSVDGHAVCFHVLAIVNIASVNIGCFLKICEFLLPALLHLFVGFYYSDDIFPTSQQGAEYFLQLFLLIKKQIIDPGVEREKPVLLLIKPFTLERSKIPELSDQKIFFPKSHRNKAKFKKVQNKFGQSQGNN